MSVTNWITKARKTFEERQNCSTTNWTGKFFFLNGFKQIHTIKTRNLCFISHDSQRLSSFSSHRTSHKTDTNFPVQHSISSLTNISQQIQPVECVFLRGQVQEKMDVNVQPRFSCLFFIHLKIHTKSSIKYLSLYHFICFHTHKKQFAYLLSNLVNDLRLHTHVQLNTVIACLYLLPNKKQHSHLKPQKGCTVAGVLRLRKCFHTRSKT